MDSANKISEDLKTKLENVIKKSNAQKKTLKKILTQLNKQFEEMKNQTKKNENKKT